MASPSAKALWRRPFIESSCLFTNKEDTNFLSRLAIDSGDFLDEADDRDICPRCYRSRKYFCYNCYVPMYSVKDRIPFVKLPVKIDIVKHPKEVDGKSTSAHAAVLAPEEVSVYLYPNFPDYSKQRVILVFPGRNAVPFQEWWHINSCEQENCSFHTQPEPHHCVVLNCSQCSPRENIPSNKCLCKFDGQTSSKVNSACKSKPENLDAPEVQSSSSQAHSPDGNVTRKPLPFDKVVFIDSTWNQTKRIYADERIRSLPCVILTSHRSYFWRHQRNKPITYLATVEAIYHFLVELHELMYPRSEYRGEYDNILFFFKFMYNKIRTLYDPNRLRNAQMYSAEGDLS